jgi:hypothetical protein
MSKTTNCNIKLTKKYDVYCGRNYEGQVPSEPHELGWLGNPIKIGEMCQICNQIHDKKSLTLSCYKNYLKYKLTNKKWKQAFLETCRGKVLGCWCKPSKCHTDIMIQAIEEFGE